MARGDLLVSIRGVNRDYRGLRPLRIEQLEIHEGDTLALLGFDRAAAEVLVDLITAASLPDTGDVEIFGTLTRDITDTDTWLRELDHFGIFSERAVLLDQMSIEQNLTLPYSLELDGVSPTVRAHVRMLADELGIPQEDLGQPVATQSPLMRARIRLGKAIALGPRVLLAEHPNAMLPAGDVPTFAAELSELVTARGLTLLVLTADATFARAVASQVLTLQPATGVLQASSGWRSWFHRS